MVMRLFLPLVAFFGLLTPRLPAAGELDTSFNPNVNGEIKALALAPDGKIFIGGSFTSVGGQDAIRIARLLPNGSRDSDWNNTIATPVPACAALVDGSVLVADSGTPALIKRFLPNGTVDQAFSPIRVSEGQLHAMGLDAENNLLLGGDFHMIGTSSCRGFGIVGMDGVIKSGPISTMGAGKAVFSLLPQWNLGTFVGGSFSALNGQSRNHLAKIGLSGTLDGQFHPSLTVGSDTSILCLASLGPSGSFFAGGSFGQISSQGTLTAKCLARFSSTGTRSGLFQPVFSHATKVPRVTSLAVQTDGRIIAAGDFTAVNGVSCKGLVRLNSDGSVDGSFSASAEGVTGLALQMDGKIIITGNFVQVNGVPRNRIARLNNGTASDSMIIQQNSVVWRPVGSAPPCDLVTFEVSTDGKATWQPLGKASVAGDTGWRVSGVLPHSGVVRILGRTPSGFQNGSSGLVDREISYVLPSPEIVVSEVQSSTWVSVTDGQTAPLDYGEISQGSTQTKTLQIFNQSSTGLTVTGIQLPRGFTWLNPVTLPTTVANVLTVTVQADTGVLGALGGTVVITSDDPDEGSFEFPLAAMVVGPEIAMRLGGVELPNDRPEPISFVRGYQGAEPLRETVVISNQGNRDLIVSAISAGAGFTVDDPQPFSLHAGESREIQVGPDQSIAGTLTANLEVYSNDSDEPVFRVPLATEVLNPLVTKVMNARTVLDRKSGRRIQKLRIINSTKTATVAGFRVIVRGLPEWVQVTNASEILPDGSVVFVIDRPFGPSAKFILPIEYEIPKGSPTVVIPHVTTEVILNNPQKAALVAEGAVVPALAVEKCERTSEGHFVLTFRSVPGRFYQVEYSADGTTWKASTPTCAAGSIVRWVDSGSPQTECSPNDVPMRLYRVREME